MGRKDIRISGYMIFYLGRVTEIGPPKFDYLPEPPHHSVMVPTLLLRLQLSPPFDIGIQAPLDTVTDEPRGN